MTNQHKVVWSEGMFLQPQHFQQQERYIQAQLAQAMCAMQVDTWGFTALKIDPGQLALGCIVLTACAALGAWGEADKPYVIPRPTAPIYDDKFDQRLAEIVAQQKQDQKPKQLGPIDKWRHESCQTDAAKAPTAQGVVQGMRVCREKFAQ